jgi:3-oxoacyl-[acyl-carrier protein] reductase
MTGFKDKVALITGGSRGIGASVALKLASLGCNIAINFNSNLEAAIVLRNQLLNYNVKVILIKADVAILSEIDKMFKSVLDEFGKIDILINSAGISQIVDYDKISEYDWDKVMNVNLKGTFFCCQAALKIMIKQHSGSIVNLSSTAGQMGGFIVGVNYSASKAGVICLTKSLSKVAIKYGVNVNCVAPGLISTEMIDEYPASIVSDMKKNIPIGRLGTAEEVADGIVFLASSQASYITGITLYINGGTYLG